MCYIYSVCLGTQHLFIWCNDLLLDCLKDNKYIKLIAFINVPYVEYICSSILLNINKITLNLINLKYFFFFTFMAIKLVYTSEFVIKIFVFSNKP